MKKIAFAFAAAALLAATSAARADDCMLMTLGSVPMDVRPDGAILVPVSVDNETVPMVLDLGDPETAVRGELAARLNLQTSAFPGHSATVYRGALVRAQVTLPRLQYATLAGDQLAVLVLPPDVNLPAGAMGVLGSRLLSNSDVEIDFARNRVNFYSKQHCAGAVVYWADSAAVVPFDYTQGGRVLFDMQLDGKPLHVSFHGGLRGEMRMTGARRVLGGATALKGAGLSPAGDMLYAYPFKTLAFGGIALNNPDIVVIDDDVRLGCNRPDKPPACFDRTDLDIGLVQLRSLHLYFAFGERKLYATAADAHK